MVVEHLLYYQLKDGVTADTLAAITTSQRKLARLPETILFEIGEAQKGSSPQFKHVLYGRYPSKEALAAYYTCEPHQKVVAESMQYVENRAVIDFEAEIMSPLSNSQPVTGMYTAMIKLKEGANEKEIMAKIDSFVKSKHDGVLQVSFGKNYADGNFNGHDWGLVLFYTKEEYLQLFVDGLTRTVPEFEDFIDLKFVACAS